MFPAEGMVYDYKLDDAGISSSKSDELMDDEVPERKEVLLLSQKEKSLNLQGKKSHTFVTKGGGGV